MMKTKTRDIFAGDTADFSTLQVALPPLSAYHDLPRYFGPHIYHANTAGFVFENTRIILR